MRRFNWLRYFIGSIVGAVLMFVWVTHDVRQAYKVCEAALPRHMECVLLVVPEYMLAKPPVPDRTRV